jgi:hypothetical protein
LLSNVNMCYQVQMDRIYLSLTEAAALSGKSEMTIRRLIKKPESTAYIHLGAGNKPFIEEEYVRKAFALSASNMVTSDNSMLTPDLIKDLVKEYSAALLLEKDKRIQGLKNELDKKDDTIRSLIQTNHQLIERDRESNIIIQSLQQGFNETLKQLSPHPSEPLKKGKKEPIGNVILYIMAALASILMLVILGTIIHRYLIN